MLNKTEIELYSKMKYDRLEKNEIAELVGFDGVEEVPLSEFEENTTVQMNCFDGFFEQIDVVRFGDRLLIEFIKLGDFQGHYKDWALHKYMSELYLTCIDIDEVFVSNYEYDEDDPMFRAFFLSMLFDASNYETFNAIYSECKNMYDYIIKYTEERLCGRYWIDVFESDELLFCRLFLTPYFKRMGFKVILNHGNTEYGKDYILITENIFGEKEFYGVQAKAGNLSGAATTNITEINNQIELAFSVPYKLANGVEIYISKLVIAISGFYTENAKNIIANRVERYKMSNIVFLSKKELENI